MFEERILLMLDPRCQTSLFDPKKYDNLCMCFTAVDGTLKNTEVGN